MSTEMAKKDASQGELAAAANVRGGFGSLQSFEFLQRVAKMLATSTLVPKEYQNNIPNCVIALNIANQLDADALMVMQNMYIVHGRPGWSSQFLISTFNTSGRFSALRYEFTGEEGSDSWGCRAWAVEKATGERLDGTIITIGMAKKEGWHSKNGSKWQTMPQQMLMYRAASFFIRAYAPEISMGMHTEDEIIEIGPDSYRVDAEARAQDEISRNANQGEIIDVDMTPPAQNSEPEQQQETVPTSNAPDF